LEREERGEREEREERNLIIADRPGLYKVRWVQVKE
jgi:hypothetical protein